MAKVNNDFLVNKLVASGNFGRPKISIPCVKGRHLTDQQHDIIFKIIKNLKEPDPLKRFYTVGLSGARRAGKTSLVARLIPLVEEQIEHYEVDPQDPTGKKIRYKNMDFFLGSMTQDKSISLYWDAIMKYSDELGLGYRSSQKNSVITTPRGNKIRFKSLRDLNVASGGRGDRYILLLVDEIQNVREEVLREFLNVTKPATSDFGGTTILLGTMAHIPAGRWYDIIQEREKNTPYFYLDWKQNHFISRPKREAMIEDERINNNEEAGNESAWFRREWFGEPVWDIESLVFLYDTKKNHFLDVDIPEEDRRYVIGVDLGFNDQDAFAVMCYCDYDPRVYLVREYTRRGQDVTSCCEKVQELCEEFNHPTVIVDSGSIGKKVMEEMIHRYGISAIPAEKSEKGGWIHVTRQHLHRGHLKIRQESKSVEEMKKTEWNENQDGWRKDGFHPDLLDAILYSFRYIYHTMHMFWQKEPEVSPPETQFEHLRRTIMGESRQNSMFRHEKKKTEFGCVFDSSGKFKSIFDEIVDNQVEKEIRDNMRGK